MATGTFTLLDVAARCGSNVHALIEGVVTYAPELAVVPTFTRSGLTYTTATRTELPSGSFAQVGAGVAPQKSVWKREPGSMYKFEAQMRVPEDVVVATLAENAGNPDVSREDVLADEAMAHLRGSAITIGSQVWYGTKISADGFAGLSTLVDTNKYEVNAGGSSGADSSSVYLVYLDANPINPQGVHFLAGNGGRMQFSDTWGQQQITDPNDSTKLTVVNTNYFLGFLGLTIGRPEAVYRAKNVIGTANGFTDAVAAAVWAKVPLGLRGDKSKWRWFMNGAALYTLQASRATVNVATGGKEGVGKGGVFPEMPESSMGIAIVPTDSLVSTERNGLKP